MASIFFAMVSDSWVWTAMLIVGLIFISVIAIGESSKALRHRRRARRRSAY